MQLCQEALKILLLTLSLYQKANKISNKLHNKLHYKLFKQIKS